MSDDTFYCSFVSIHYIICECGETFPTEEELKLHLENGHGKIVKEKKEYRCYLCDSFFDTEESCIEHYESTHVDIKEEHDYVETYTQGDEADVKPFDIPEVEQDQEIDYVNSPTQEDVIIPAEAVETKPKSNRKPKSYYNQRNIVCEVCGKRYASNAALKYHQRIHTGERPYKCTLCPKSFTMPLFLQIHIRTHTGERPYECQLCPKAFSNKAALLRHDRVHTGIKPYECPKCGKFFTQSNSMKLHVNTVHLKQPAPYKSKNRKKAALQRRNTLLQPVYDEDDSAVQNLKSENILDNETVIYVKPEMGLYSEQEENIILEEVGEGIAYEVIYQE